MARSLHRKPTSLSDIVTALQRTKGSNIRSAVYDRTHSLNVVDKISLVCDFGLAMPMQITELATCCDLDPKLQNTQDDMEVWVTNTNSGVLEESEE